MVKKLLVLLSLLLTSTASAGSAFSVRTGFGVTTEKRSALFSVSWEDELVGNAVYRMDLGAWTDNEPGHSSAPFGSGLIGYRFGNFNSFNVAPAFGILVMGYPDSVLGSPFNFTEEVAIGYQCVSTGWKHVSNGGLGSPNLGRDYWFVTVAFPMGD